MSSHPDIAMGPFDGRAINGPESGAKPEQPPPEHPDASNPNAPSPPAAPLEAQTRATGQTSHSTIPLVVIAIVAVMLFVGMAMRFVRTGPAPTSAPFALIPTSVETAVVSRNAINQEIAYQADVLPAQDVAIRTSGDGFITSLAVSLGDSVSQGQLLAIIDSTDFTNELIRTTSDLQNAHDATVRAEKTYVTAHKNHLDLFNQQPSPPFPGLVSRLVNVTTEEHQAEILWREALLAEERLSFRLSELRADQRDHAVRAPLAGKITALYAQPGDLAYRSHATGMPTHPLLCIRPDSSMRLTFLWDDSHGTAPLVGTNVVYRLDTESIDRSTRISRVTTTGDDASPSSTTIECDIPPVDGNAMKPVHAAVRMEVVQRVDALTIPPDAIHHRAGGAFVWLLDAQDVVVERPINTGVVTPLQVEVLSGLEQGDHVIRGHPSTITAGKVVSPMS